MYSMYNKYLHKYIYTFKYNCKYNIYFLNIYMHVYVFTYFTINLLYKHKRSVWHPYFYSLLFQHAIGLVLTDFKEDMFYGVTRCMWTLPWIWSHRLKTKKTVYIVINNYCKYLRLKLHISDAYFEKVLKLHGLLCMCGRVFPYSLQHSWKHTMLTPHIAATSTMSPTRLCRAVIYENNKR